MVQVIVAKIAIVEHHEEHTYKITTMAFLQHYISGLG